jgi:hypothetical protein
MYSNNLYRPPHTQPPSSRGVGPMNAVQSRSLSIRRNDVPFGFHCNPMAWKSASGTCIQEAPTGVHRKTFAVPVTMASRGSEGSHMAALTGSFWSKTATSSREGMDHTHTAVGMLSLRVARYWLSALHSSRPAAEEDGAVR